MRFVSKKDKLKIHKEQILSSNYHKPPSLNSISPSTWGFMQQLESDSSSDEGIVFLQQEKSMTEQTDIQPKIRSNSSTSSKSGEFTRFRY